MNAAFTYGTRSVPKHVPAPGYAGRGAKPQPWHPLAPVSPEVWNVHDANDEMPLHPETMAIIAGRPPHEPDQPMSVPVHLTSTYVAGGPMD